MSHLPKAESTPVKLIIPSNSLSPTLVTARDDRRVDSEAENADALRLPAGRLRLYNEQDGASFMHDATHRIGRAFSRLLVEGNRSWCHRAQRYCQSSWRTRFPARVASPTLSIFLILASPSRNLALEGTAMGLVVHAMQGFDFEKARTTLSVPDDYSVCAMFAVGRPGDPANLPRLTRAAKPSSRKPVREISSGEGAFTFH